MKMKCVILDGHALNPGDLSWDDLRDFCDLTVYERTPANLVVERAKDADLVLTNKTEITTEMIAALPNLKYIGVLATGYNVVDIEAAKARNIPVTNIPAYSSNAVAQLVFAHILEICHHVGHHSEQVFKGRWSNSLDFAFWDYPLIELDGKTLGIIGFGNIGKRVSRIAQAFGMRVLVYNRTIYKEFENENLQFVDLDTLLSQSDFITLHMPLSKETRGFIDREKITKMKDGVVLINTSRGPLLVENDVVEALKSGKIAAAGVDVASKEPIPSDSPLLTAPNLFITPHIGWAPIEARKRLMKIAVDNIKGFINHALINVVNGVTL